MTEFGTFPGRESRVYTVTLGAHAVPVSLHFPVTGGGAREFVFVPDPRMAKEFAAPFEGMSHSKALGSIYQYIDRERREVALDDADTGAAGRRREATFALVQWNKATKVEFPREVHCILRVPYGRNGQAMHEVVRAIEGADGSAGGAR